MGNIWEVLTHSFITAYLLLGLTSLLTCSLMTAAVKDKALEIGLIAKPSVDRWHRKSTALCGGIAIFVALVPTWIVAVIISVVMMGFSCQSLVSVSAPLIFGSVFLFLMGLLDDIKGLPPWIKLFCQICTASLVVVMGHRLHWSSFVPLDSCLTVMWIVLVTNSFNLIDNMDGLSAGVCLVVSLFFAYLFYFFLPIASFFAVILAGVCGGFLIFNFHPAKIFMGDCGSQVLGFCCSMFGILYAENRTELAMLACLVPILLSAVPLSDTVFVSVNRLREGRSVFVGGCDHTSHKLVSLGLTEKQTVTLLYGVTMLFGLCAVLIEKV